MAENHTVVIENLGELKRKVNISIDVENVKLALDEAAGVVAKKTQINGFRKGKAPKKMVEKKYYGEVENVAIFMLTQSGFSRACKEQLIYPISEPKIQNAEICVDGTFKCEVLLEVKPQIIPMGYVGMMLKKDKTDLNLALEQRISDLYKHHSNKEVRKEIQDGFEITLDFWMLIDGQKISEGKDKVFVIKKDQEPPFGGNLIGAKMGDMATSTIILPNEYPNYGGKQVEIKMDIKLVCEIIKPTQGQLVEKTKAPSYDELLDVIKSDVEKTAQNQERAFIEEQIIDKLLETHDFPVPENWVNDEEKFLIGQLQVSNPDEDLKKTIRQMSERNVKRTFIIESIYEAENSLKLTEEEVEEYMKIEAGKLNISTLQFKKELKKQNLVDGVISLIKNNKVMNFIITNTQVEENL